MGPSLLCGCSEAWSVKTPQHWGLYQPPCHWVVSPANWGMLEEAEWALAWAQLWSGQHWKHTHVHMHHTSQDPSHCPLHIHKRTAVLVASLCGLKLWRLCCFLTVSPYHSHIISQSAEALARAIGKDLQMARGLFRVTCLDVMFV